MGGNVTVTSELGIGSCFTATVIAPVGMRSNIQKAPQLQESFEGETVLIVEDNRVNQLVAKRMCQKLGLTVYIASNGIEAIKKSATNTFQCRFNGSSDAQNGRGRSNWHNTK